METFRNIMYGFMIAWIVVFFGGVLFFVIVPASIKSKELTWKKLIFAGIPLVAFGIFRMIYVDPHIPRWLDDIIGHW